MKITPLGDGHTLGDAVALADTIRQRLDDAGYYLAVVHPDTDSDPDIVLVALTDTRPYVVVSLTGQLYHLGGDTEDDTDPATAYADAYLDGLLAPVAVADTVACGSKACQYLGEHRHGDACYSACPCKAVRYAGRSHTTSNDPGDRLAAPRSAQEPSSAPADHPGGSQGRTEAPAGSGYKPGPRR